MAPHARPGDSPPLPALLQLDARALSLLSALQWPNRQRATLEQLLQLHYPDVRDVLLGLAGADCIPTAAANKDWPDVAAAAAAAPCLAPYWDLQAQEELHVRHCAQRLRRQAAMVEAAAAVLARRAEQAGEPAAGPAGEQPTGAAAPAGQQPPGAAAAAGSAATGGDAAAEAAAMLRQEWDRGESAAAGQSHASAWAGVMHGKADEQLRMLVALAFEEGALALSAVHQHFAGGLAREGWGWAWGWASRATCGHAHRHLAGRPATQPCHCSPVAARPA